MRNDQRRNDVESMLKSLIRRRVNLKPIYSSNTGYICLQKETLRFKLQIKSNNSFNIS